MWLSQISSPLLSASTLTMCLKCLFLVSCLLSAAAAKAVASQDHTPRDTLEFGARIKSTEGGSKIADSEAVESTVNLQIPLHTEEVDTLAPVPVLEHHIHHHHIDHVRTHEEEEEEPREEERQVWDIGESVAGTPHEDYAPLRSIPKTTFNCDARKPGYYADIDTQCQVFHRCSETEESTRKQMTSFLCLNRTTFNQEILSCDWRRTVRCDQATKFYNLNQELNMRGEDGKYIELPRKRDARVEKPLSPGIVPKSERFPLPPEVQSPRKRIQSTPPSSHHQLSNSVDLEDRTDLITLPSDDPSQITPHSDNDSEEKESTDVDMTYFFTPQQLLNIRRSRGFGEKLKRASLSSSDSGQTVIFKMFPLVPRSAANKLKKSNSEKAENSNLEKLLTSAPTPLPASPKAASTDKPITRRYLFYHLTSSKAQAPRADAAQLRKSKEKLLHTKKDSEMNLEETLKEFEPLETNTDADVETRRQPLTTIRRIRRLKYKKPNAEKTKLENWSSLSGGKRDLEVFSTASPTQEESFIDDGTRRKLKYKDTDITEPIPPLMSAHPQQLHPPHPPYVVFPPYSPHFPLPSTHTLFPFANYPTPLQFPHLPIYPPLRTPYEPLPESRQGSHNSLPQPHQALSYHALGNPFAHHYHAVLPQNPHYAAQSHFLPSAYSHADSGFPQQLQQQLHVQDAQALSTEQHDLSHLMSLVESGSHISL